MTPWPQGGYTPGAATNADISRVSLKWGRGQLHESQSFRVGMFICFFDLLTNMNGSVYERVEELMRQLTEFLSTRDGSGARAVVQELSENLSDDVSGEEFGKISSCSS